MRACRRLPAIVGIIVLCCAWPAHASELEAASVEQFQGTLAQMRQLTAACNARIDACDAKKVSPDQIVTAPNVFTMHWDWLSAALQQAHRAKDEERTALMRDCMTRLDEIEQQVAANPDADFNRARKTTDAILASDEFQTVHPVSWWDRLSAWFWDKFRRIAEGLRSAGGAISWIWSFLEWALFLSAGALLLFFLLRSLARQRMNMNLGEGSAKLNAWNRASMDWVQIADASAAAGDWREAVHALYWAAIVHLEARRAWRHNPSRTPREYVRLLKPGSLQQRNLRGLTQIFERVWYGFDEAADQEYQEARALFNGLSQPDPAAPSQEAA